MLLRLLPEPRKIVFSGGTMARPIQEPGGVQFTLAASGQPQGYELTIDRKAIRISGYDAAGLFYGLQTLRQIVSQCGPRLPCLRIEDAPAFRHRGYLLDVSRGRVPRLAVLKRLADRMATLKMNQLQLYVEHVFDFAFDPDISAGCDPLTSREIRELDAYCLARHIELVPCLACFGHMGRILSLPRYRALAEIPWPYPNWESAPWKVRLRGATLNPQREGSRRLIRKMLDEYLPLFTSTHFNMCGDETYDLGRGGVPPRPSVAHLYLHHLRFVRSVARAHGKRLMFWGDVMLKHPEAIRRLPRDCIALDWGYERDTHFEKARPFIRRGLETYVCPSTRGYKVVFNEVEEARANIAGYARAGHRLGASGLLLTDWGDVGHFNLPTCSLHGMALGAALAWNPHSSEGRSFDRAFSLHMLGDSKGQAAELFVEMGSTGLAEWPLLLRGPTETASSPQRARRAVQLEHRARKWQGRLARWKPAGGLTRVDIEELSLAVRALHLNACRLRIEKKTALREQKSALARRAIQEWIDEMECFFKEYARVWRRSSRPAGLRDLARAWTNVLRQWRFTIKDRAP